jgi:hypothetical protein
MDHSFQCLHAVLPPPPPLSLLLISSPTDAAEAAAAAAAAEAADKALAIADVDAGDYWTRLMPEAVAAHRAAEAAAAAGAGLVLGPRKRAKVDYRERWGEAVQVREVGG